MNASTGKELLFSVTGEDCEFQTFCGSGKGGQHRNKVATAVRCIHKASGAVGNAQDERSQWQNKKLAFKRMAESKKFQAWLKLETGRQLLSAEEKRNQETPEQAVERMMAPENLKIEVLENGKWVEKHDQLQSSPPID